MEAMTFADYCSVRPSEREKVLRWNEGVLNREVEELKEQAADLIYKLDNPLPKWATKIVFTFEGKKMVGAIQAKNTRYTVLVVNRKGDFVCQDTGCRFTKYYIPEGSVIEIIDPR